jgi:nucleoside-diphosphate-sugar epimerase
MVGQGAQAVAVPHLEDAGAWDRVLPGADAIVHCAGLAHVADAAAVTRRDEFTRVNVQGTAVLASAAVRHGVRRFVFVSSIGVNGSRTEGRPFGPADPPDPKGVYADSKLRAERALADVAQHSSLETVIIRPCLVVGPGVPGNLGRLVALLRRGFWLPFGAIDNRRSLIGIDALAELLAIAAEHPRAPGQLFLAAHQHAISTPGIIRALARGAGLKPRLIDVPVPMLRLMGTLARRRPDVDRLCDSLEVDASATRTVLGWTCTTPIETELERVAAGAAHV